MSKFQRRILILGGDLSEREELRRMIASDSEHRFDFAEANVEVTASQLAKESGDDPYDCALLKYDKPNLNAVEMLAAFCGDLNSPQSHTPFPIVVLTGDTVGKELLRGGAQGYLKKGSVTSESLALAIDNAIERFEMLVECKKSERALRESEEKFRLLLEAAPDAMIIVDQSGMIALVNAETVRLFGYSRDELIGHSLEMLVPQRFRAKHNALRDEYGAAPQVRVMGKGQLLSAIRKDGSEFPVEISLSPIAASSGMLVSSSIRDMSDRVVHDQAILSSEARLALGVEVAGLALAEIDYSSNMVYLTVNAARLFGLVQVNLVVPRATIHGTFHPDDRAEMMVLIEESLSPDGRGWFAMDHRVVWPNGEVHWLRVRKQVYFEGEGTERQPVRAMLAVLDVTAEKNAAEIVRASGEFVRGVLDSLPEHVVVLDNLGTVLAVNQPSDRHTMESGATLSTAAIGVNYLDLCRQSIAQGGHDVHHMIEGLEEVLAGARTEFSTEYPCLAPGREEWFLMRAQRMRSENAGVILSHSNITESRSDQLRLEDSEVRFRRLFEAAHDGILILDAMTHKITHVNPFLTSLLQYPAEHFLGKELWEIGFLKDKQASVLAMKQLDEAGSIRYEGLPLEDRLGQKHPVEMVANKYEEGMHPVIQCNIRDISERRKLEKQTLIQAAELSDLHRRKDEFLAMLSHELRSPLAPIANAVQLLGLANAGESALQRQARGIIERQVSQLQHLVDDLLEVSRITTGRVQLRQERVAIGGIVDGAIETARPLIDQRKHELIVSMPPETLWLNADAARLEQVVVNLLTNAAKYTEERGKIWLNVLAEGGDCVLRVRDTGVGIAPALLPKIFDLFTQAERSLDRSQGGLGIGLALVKRLTELHGGSVEVHSSLGQGSEFIVHLPLMASEPGHHTNATAVNAPNSERALRVLVVDDNVDTVLSFSILLRATGHEVFIAHDGVAAVQAAIDCHPDVVLLDIGLPGLDGYEVAKRIRQQLELKDVVLVALTGYGQDTDRQRSSLAGFNHHLVKPARFEQLQEILRAVAVGAFGNSPIP